MSKFTLQTDFKSPVEYIDSAEALNKVFNDPENNRKVSLIRQYRFAGEMDKAQKVKTSLPGLIFIADDFDETEKEVTVYENGEEEWWDTLDLFSIYHITIRPGGLASIETV